MSELLSSRTLGELISVLAKSRPEMPALKDGSGAETTYGDFQARTLKLCAAVAARGLKKGARVAVLSKNRIEFAETFGLAQLGLIIVPLNWRLGADQLFDLIKDCAPEAIFVDNGHLDVIEAHLEALPSVKLSVCYDGPKNGFVGYEALLSDAATNLALPDVSPSDPLSIIYTSGTTGKPKGAVVTHRGALANMQMSLDNLLQLTSEDRVLAAMPFFHVGGLWYHFFASFASGCETTILPEFNPKGVLQAMTRDQITVVHLVPTMVSALIGDEDFAVSDLSALRRIFYAGSPMPSVLLQRAMTVMENCEFLQSYGSTEAGIIAALTPDDHRQALTEEHAFLLRSCGRPISGIEVRIADADGEMALGQIGEIEVQGDAAIEAYWENPAASKEIRNGDWVKTGDLGFFNPKGYLFLVDRKNDMIVTGGENVFPTEIEDHLLRLEGIGEAAVFGTPHPKWIEQVTAVVVPKVGYELDASDILSDLKKELAHYKCPKKIFIAERLPKNAVGKVVRAQLRKHYASREDEE